MAEPLLLARVVARLAALHHAGALQRPLSLVPFGPDRDAAMALASLLWDWMLALDTMQRLIAEVFEPARVEPGRQHQRVSEMRAQPRGTIHWPRTSQLALQRGDASQLAFVCSRAERSVLAPENLLLIATLDAVLERTQGLVTKLAASQMASPMDRSLARRFAGEARLAWQAPWMRTCRDVLRSDPRPASRLEHELEQALRARVQGRPSAAPSWARTLLELRSRRRNVPSDAALAALSDDALHDQLAWLEVVTLLRTHRALRQREHAERLAAPEGWVFEAHETGHAWVLGARDGPTLALLRGHALEFEPLRRDAILACFDTVQRGHAIDRWIVVHRAGDTPPCTVLRRKALELVFWRLDATSTPPSDLLTRVDSWLNES